MIAAILAGAAAAFVPTPVGVAEREYRISLYRPSVPVGQVRFNITNFGEDGHNLAVKGGAASPEIQAGERGTFVVRFRKKGTYTLVCTILDHEERGMKAKIKVTPRPRPRKTA